MAFSPPRSSSSIRDRVRLFEQMSSPPGVSISARGSTGPPKHNLSCSKRTISFPSPAAATSAVVENQQCAFQDKDSQDNGSSVRPTRSVPRTRTPPTRNLVDVTNRTTTPFSSPVRNRSNVIKSNVKDGEIYSSKMKSNMLKSPTLRAVPNSATPVDDHGTSGDTHMTMEIASTSDATNDTPQTNSMVKELLHKFEQHNTKERKHQQSSKLTVAPLTEGEDKSSWLSHLLDSPKRATSCRSNQPPHGQRKRKAGQKYRNWKRFWEMLYAGLALLELLTCSSGVVGRPKAQITKLTVARDATEPLAFVTLSQDWPELEEKHGKRMPPPLRHSPRWKRIPYVGTTYSQYLSRYLVRNFPTSHWQEWINRAFVIALLIHTVLESWIQAASRKELDEAKTKQSSVLVTQRSSRRLHKLETSSSNRHFIMRWTGNRIKWNRVTSEVLRASFIIFLLRLLFLPFLTENPLSFAERQQEIGFLKFRGNQKQLPAPAIAAGGTISFGEALLVKLSSWCYGTVVTQLRRKVKAYTIRFATLALTRPWETSMRVQKVFTLIRWAKFATPFVGRFNKLRGHYNDYLKKKDRKYRSEKAHEAWAQVAKSIQGERQLEKAVRQIQQNFRAKQKKDQEAEMGDMTKVRFRVGNVNDCALVTRQPKRRKSTLDAAQHFLKAEHRSLVVSLKSEIKARARRNRKLLLRPNTAFAVTWRRTTVACVLLEIVQLSLAHSMTSNFEKVPVDKLVKFLLSPSLDNPASVSHLQLWLVLVEYSAVWIAQLVSLLSFLDVFITFFTGELDEQTGILVSKPFFKRWILPGVALQLLVNPTMKDISRIVKRLGNFAKDVGPMRVFHVSVALLPILQIVSVGISDVLNHFVNFENRKVRVVAHLSSPD